MVKVFVLLVLGQTKQGLGLTNSKVDVKLHLRERERGVKLKHSLVKLPEVHLNLIQI